MNSDIEDIVVKFYLHPTVLCLLIDCHIKLVNLKPGLVGSKSPLTTIFEELGTPGALEDGISQWRIATVVIRMRDTATVSPLQYAATEPLLGRGGGFGQGVDELYVHEVGEAARKVRLLLCCRCGGLLPRRVVRRCRLQNLKYLHCES